VKRHPKLATQAINVTSAAIAFSAEIGSAANNFRNGIWFSNPEAGLNELLFVSTGIHTDGSIDYNRTTASALAKVGGYAFNKVAKWFLKRMRF
jgi:hypothetical protein